MSKIKRIRDDQNLREYCDYLAQEIERLEERLETQRTVFEMHRHDDYRNVIPLQGHE